ncbi:MAG: DUF1674 domain-containing protein [Pontixanthobacter sp.]
MSKNDKKSEQNMGSKARQQADLKPTDGETSGTKEKNEAAKKFEKPAGWTNDPAPEPKAVDPEKDEPRERSPTRYGDWEKDGIAWDF